MNWTMLWGIVAIVFALALLTVTARLLRVREQLSQIQDALADIKDGNLNRRILTRRGDMTRSICYDINQIAMNDQAKLVEQQQSEQAYKRLMTSLSHDVKTPLTSLLGYLEAVQTGIIKEDEKDAYLQIAYEKARHLSEFVQTLFEWVKLDSKEQVFHFEKQDIYELTRNILTDWIPTLESAGIDYYVLIPETECTIRLDAAAYTRIVNNLLQNVLIHSGATKVTVKLVETKDGIQLSVCDNGKGIPLAEQQHIFERMYQCDASRNARGNGLGLSIVRELAAAHHGTATIQNNHEGGTAFIVELPHTLP